MNFQLQRFAGRSETWVTNEDYDGVANCWHASKSAQERITINGVSKLERVNDDDLIATLAGALKDVTYTNICDYDVNVEIDGETYTMKAGVTDGKFVEDEAGEVVSTSIINKTKRADGKVISKTLNFINPAASDNDISTFMAALNSLSKNTKDEIIRVDKRVL